MSKPILLLLAGLFCLSFSFSTHFLGSKNAPAWGFFGHKRINRLAIFTLPSPLMGLYKREMEYVTEQAIAPDKRRFVSPVEGFRHYINLDRRSFFPIDKVEAQILNTEIYVVAEEGDTLLLIDYQTIRKQKHDYYLKGKPVRRLFGRDSIVVADSFYRRFFIQNLIKIQADAPLSIHPDSLKNLFFKERFAIKNFKSAFAKDRLSQHGVLPYHLYFLQKQLTDAFLLKDKKRILRLSAEMGHYLADGHVPLHTVSNYDGQFSEQLGIHAFWESRLPELFANDRYDFFVGQAEYIENPKVYFWEIIRKSHKLAAEVLRLEKEVASKFPVDKQYCIETMGSLAVRKPCFEFAEAYHNALAGMVEAQMRAAILSIGSAWYTAWVDAGQPDLTDLYQHPLSISNDSGGKSSKNLDQKELEQADSLMQKGGRMIGRDEGN